MGGMTTARYLHSSIRRYSSPLLTMSNLSSNLGLHFLNACFVMLLCYIKTIDICRIYTTWCKIRDKSQISLFEVSGIMWYSGHVQWFYVCGKGFVEAYHQKFKEYWFGNYAYQNKWKFSPSQVILLAYWHFYISTIHVAMKLK